VADEHTAVSAPERTTNRGLWIGLAAGVLIGLALNRWGENPLRESLLRNVLEPLGGVFLRALFVTVIPLVFCSVAASIASLGSLAHIRRLGLRLAVFYTCTSMAAIFIGQVLVSVVRPGRGVPVELAEEARMHFASQLGALSEKSATAADSLWPGILQQLIPRNIVQALAEGNMLALVAAAIVLGIALLTIDRRRAEPAAGFLQAMSDACVVIVGWIMKLAPYAVAALIATTLARFGSGIVQQIGAYVGVVVAGYLIHFFVTYGLIVKVLLKMSPVDFFRKGLPVFLTAFSTSSSNATIPTTIRTLEKRFGVPENITSFTVPLGATVNMDGTALFEGIVVMFVAQVFGIDLTFAQQCTVVVLVFLTAIGVAGIPGGSLPLIMSVMAAVGVPPEGIALILGVDRLLDMGRTVLNVTGDVLCALYLAQREGAKATATELHAPAR
jgi:DAACS family dicarboxylate/amino acid:cation (Na+ or H+) symporter